LLREARRRKGLANVQAPSVCIVDLDSDLVRQRRKSGAAVPSGGWPCYHTELDTFELAGQRIGIVGRAVYALEKCRDERVHHMGDEALTRK
jgi:pyruvate/2-oxoacid:ferredoxin oxidoreductase beta subunit